MIVVKVDRRDLLRQVEKEKERKEKGMARAFNHLELDAMSMEEENVAKVTLQAKLVQEAENLLLPGAQHSMDPGSRDTDYLPTASRKCRMEVQMITELDEIPHHRVPHHQLCP